MKKKEIFLHAIFWLLTYSYTYLLIEYMGIFEDYMYPYIISLCLYMLTTSFVFTTSALVHKFFKYGRFKSFKVMKHRYQRNKRRKRINKLNKTKLKNK
jgi:hypothetical protein